MERKAQSIRQLWPRSGRDTAALRYNAASVSRPQHEIPAMAAYQSDLTQFMNAFLEKNPQVVADRQAFRLTLWDRDLDIEEQRRFRASAVAQKPYVYNPD